MKMHYFLCKQAVSDFSALNFSVASHRNSVNIKVMTTSIILVIASIIFNILYVMTWCYLQTKIISFDAAGCILFF